MSDPSSVPTDPPEAPAPDAAPKAKRGFAAMDPEQRRLLAQKGGRAAHAAGTAHEFTTEEARLNGIKGGKASHAKRRAKQQENGG